MNNKLKKFYIKDLYQNDVYYIWAENLDLAKNIVIDKILKYEDPVFYFTRNLSKDLLNYDLSKIKNDLIEINEKEIL